MSVVQRNTWRCDLCGAIEEQCVEESAFSDPVITPPQAWDVYLEVPEAIRSHPNEDIADACQRCAKNPDWSRYPNKKKDLTTV